MSTDMTTPAYPQHPLAEASATGQPCTVSVEQFLATLLPPNGDGYYCASKGGMGGFWKDMRTKSIDEIVGISYAASNSGYNAYFAPSVFEKHTITEGGKEKFRTQSNSIYLKCLFLDIDCGREGKPYATWTDALYALHSFCLITGLPRPIVVVSGQGLHVYWPLTEQIPTEDWGKLASMLAELCRIHGLHVDLARTEDSASVLRVPGTINYGKDGIARNVYILEWAESTTPEELCKALFAAYPDGSKPSFNTKGKARPAVSVPPLPVNTPQEVAANFPSMDTLADARPCIDQCRQFREMGFAAYPNWFNGLNLARYLENGREVARALSAQDASRFSEDVFQLRFGQAEEMSGGPTLCSTFEANDPERCNSCLWKGKISTPKELGNKAQSTRLHVTPGEKTNTSAAGQVTEERIAAEFAAAYKDTLRYCGTLGAWYEWLPQLHVWKRDETNRVFHYVREMCKALNPDGKTSLGKSSTALGVERFAKADPQFAITEDQLDSHIHLIGTPSGVISLKK